MPKTIPKIELGTLEYSLSLLLPKPAFFEWLDQVATKNGLTVANIYFEEEDPVFIVPPFGRFGSSEDFQHYLTQLKPKLLERALGAWIRDSADFPPTLNAETFDEFFSIKKRDQATSVDDLEPPVN